MLMFVMMKPRQFYKEDGKTLRCWRDIDFDHTETLFNIYIYSVALAVFSYYVSKS
jgi:hypothetical protein